MTSILISIAALGALIIIHELGHFLMARLVGVAVTDFSLGFGQKLFTKEFGGTSYSLSLIPLGGYVKMLDEEIEEGEGPPGKPISSVSPFARIAIAFAGPVANLAFTLIAYSWITFTGIPHQTTLIGSVLPDTPAATRFLSGDRVLSVNGKMTPYWENMLAEFARSNGSSVPVVVIRTGHKVSTNVTPVNLSGRWIIGVRAAGETTKEEIPVLDALPKAIAMTSGDVWASATSFTQIFSNLGQLGGPIMIAQVGAERSKMGAVAMLTFMAFLSANLFVLNLLPIPVLDGGAIVMNLWEVVFKKPLPEKFQKIVMATGSVFVLALVAVIVMGDVVRLFR